MPRDLLTLLLEAQDPETDRRLCEAEVRANIITFIAAGHETTANAIAWSLFLLSQSEEWREQVAAEAERELAGPIEGLAEELAVWRGASCLHWLRLRAARGHDRACEHHEQLRAEAGT